MKIPWIRNKKNIRWTEIVFKQNKFKKYDLRVFIDCRSSSFDTTHWIYVSTNCRDHKFNSKKNVCKFQSNLLNISNSNCNWAMCCPVRLHQSVMKFSDSVIICNGSFHCMKDIEVKPSWWHNFRQHVYL